MVLKITKGEKFIPKYNGNDKAKDPIAFNIHYLLPGEREEVYYSAKASENGVRFNLKTAFTNGVDSIENLQLEVDGKTVDIKTVNDFLAYPLPLELYSEVAYRIINTMGVDVPS